MSGDDSNQAAGRIDALLNRRSVLKTAAASAAGAALFSGSASANELARINFCGTSQVCVKAEGFGFVVVGWETDEGYGFKAVSFREIMGSDLGSYQADTAVDLCYTVEEFAGHHHPDGHEPEIIAVMQDGCNFGNPAEDASGALGALEDATLRDPIGDSFDGCDTRKFGTVKCGDRTVEIVEGNCDGGGDEENTDVDVLNYALTLEHLEYAFYRDGLEQFGEGAFADAGFPSDARQNLLDIRDHEKSHVETLTSVIEDLGGNPVGEACYEFGYSNPGEFVAIAKVLENTGVSAYDGAISRIDSAKLQTAGATIATVEARHAAYLNDLNGQDPFPAAFDEAKSMQEILDAAGGFVVPCE